MRGWACWLSNLRFWQGSTKLPGKPLMHKCGSWYAEHVLLMLSSMLGLGMGWNWLLGARAKLQNLWFLGCVSKCCWTKLTVVMEPLTLGLGGCMLSLLQVCGGLTCRRAASRFDTIVRYINDPKTVHSCLLVSYSHSLRLPGVLAVGQSIS